MRIRYHRDAGGGSPHIYDHGVSEGEVEELLRHPGALVPGRKGARLALGQTRAGRYLKVVFVPDPAPDSVFVITAYPLEGKALAAYRRRRRRP
jgi:hypothetical protein